MSTNEIFVFIAVALLVLGLVTYTWIGNVSDEGAEKLEQIHDRLTELEQDSFLLKDKTSLLIRSTGGFWETGNGAILRVRDMTDSHLLNALAWLKEQNLKKGNHLVESIRLEMARRRRNERMAIVAPVVSTAAQGQRETHEGQTYIVELPNSFMVFRNRGTQMKPDFVARAKSLDEARGWCP